MESTIVVVGSSNTDLVVRADRFPSPGETVLGGKFLITAGGKGANQAVAASRLGGNVKFICNIGKDLFGQQSLQQFKNEGIDTDAIMFKENVPSGVALIIVNKDGENQIVVAPGANDLLSETDLNVMNDCVNSSSILLCQLEIPLQTVMYAVEIAHNKGAKVILNPAPACALPNEIFKYISIITPNEKEASLLSGIQVCDLETAKEAAKVIANKGVETVIITMGSKGALIFQNGEYVSVNSPVVNAVDTTAAGDVFNGALVVALAEGKNINSAVEFGCKVAAVSVTKMGAQTSIPYKEELLQLGVI